MCGVFAAAVVSGKARRTSIRPRTRRHRPQKQRGAMLWGCGGRGKEGGVGRRPRTGAVTRGRSVAHAAGWDPIDGSVACREAANNEHEIT